MSETVPAPPAAQDLAAPTAPTQKGFQLDLNLCTGCGACAVACAIENELDWGTSWRWIETFNPDHVPGLPLHHLSLACNHCADAPCMAHCPTLAYSKDPLTGAVLLDQDRCIGCRYCTWACPYDAPRFDARVGVVSKCTFCHHRQLEGEAPACVSQCPTGALRFGDLNELGGERQVRGFPTTDAEPSVRFVPLRHGARAPEVDPALAASLGELPRQSPPHKTSLASEWPLVVFTLLAALLVGLMATARGRAWLPLPLFVALVGLAVAASTLHLGRRLRAWRSLANLRRSWLSREVALFAVFAGLSTLHLALAPAAEWTGPAAAAAGVALLFAIDRVYRVTETPGLEGHSARALLTGALVVGLAAQVPAIWMGAAGLKLVLYTGRKVQRRLRGWGGRPFLSAVRVLAGLLAPAGVLLLAPGEWLPFALALFALGEVVDRAEFYLELDPPTPARQMAQDLERMRAAI